MSCLVRRGGAHRRSGDLGQLFDPCRRAGALCEDWDPLTDGGPELGWLEEKLGRFINKRVVHVTAERQRLDRDSEAQFVDDVTAKVMIVSSRFIERLPVEKRAWFPQLQLAATVEEQASGWSTIQERIYRPHNAQHR